jgi:hypothetical protein
MSHLYGDDFYAWTQQQAEAVRAGNWDAIDREHLAEESKTGGSANRASCGIICANSWYGW